MIGDTLSHTKRATYSVGITTGKTGPLPQPAGTGFFLSEDGLFATAAHVVEAGTPTSLLKEDTGDPDVNSHILVEGVSFCDKESDFALLRTNQEWGKPPDAELAYLRPSERRLDEAEPVYSFGYPLCEPGSGLVITVDQMKELLGFAGVGLGALENPEGIKGNAMQFGGTMMMTHRLSPRTTSAIVASRIEYEEQGKMEWPPQRDSNYYVLDKALNYGNSGGPILAVETGHVHAFCTRFQPVFIPQQHLDPPIHIFMPSLYGVVTRLTHPRIRSALEEHGVDLVAD